MRGLMANADTYTPVPIRQVAALVAPLIQALQFSGLDLSKAVVGDMTLEQMLEKLVNIAEAWETTPDGHLLVVLDLPTSDPGVANALWNNGGTLYISQGPTS